MANNIAVKQTPLFLKPVETRHLTDKFFIVLLPLSLLLWLGIGIYEIINENIYESFDFRSYLKWPFGEYFIYGVVTVLVIILLLFILNKLKNDWLVFIVTIFIVIFILIVITCILGKIFYLAELDLSLSLLTLSILSIVVIYNITIFICTREMGAASLAPMIKEPIRAIVHYFPASVFSLVIIFFLLIVLMYTVTFIVAIVNNLEYIEQVISRTEMWHRVCLLPFALSGIFIFNFIWNLEFMAMGDYFASYYDGQHVSLIYIFQSIKRITRYHLGTLAFVSTPILPLICALFMTFKYNKQPGKQSNYKLVNFISKISLIINISEYALIQTSVYGSSIFKSIKQMVDLHYSNPLLFLTLNAVPLKIMDLIMLITMTIGLFVSNLVGLSKLAQYFYLIHDPTVISFLIVTYYLLTLFVYSINALLMRPAVCTFTIYKMIREQHESETSGEQNELIEH